MTSEERAAAAEAKEQEHKARMVRAEKVALRLWKALALLEDADKKKAADAARAFRDLHVRRTEAGTFELLTD